MAQFLTAIKQTNFIVVDITWIIFVVWLCWEVGISIRDLFR